MSKSARDSAQTITTGKAMTLVNVQAEHEPKDFTLLLGRASSVETQKANGITATAIPSTMNQTISLFSADDATCEVTEGLKKPDAKPSSINLAPWPPGGVKWYYSDASCAIACADCREILLSLPKVDLVLTDPQYGIDRANGMGGKGYDGFGRGEIRNPRKYEGDWDSERPSKECFQLLLAAAPIHIIWGGNYFADILPKSTKWLCWDKEQTMPSFSDCELAWTSLVGNSVKMFRYNGSGLMAVEKERFHPTQKPVSLMIWCLSFAPDAQLILDPFMGSGATLRAAKDLGRKAIGIEIEERYCEIAAKRMTQEVFEFD